MRRFGTRPLAVFGVAAEGHGAIDTMVGGVARVVPRREGRKVAIKSVSWAGVGHCTMGIGGWNREAQNKKSKCPHLLS